MESENDDFMFPSSVSSTPTLPSGPVLWSQRIEAGIVDLAHGVGAIGPNGPREG